MDIFVDLTWYSTCMFMCSWNHVARNDFPCQMNWRFYKLSLFFNKQFSWSFYLRLAQVDSGAMQTVEPSCTLLVPLELKQASICQHGKSEKAANKQISLFCRPAIFWNRFCVMAERSCAQGSVGAWGLVVFAPPQKKQVKHIIKHYFGVESVVKNIGKKQKNLTKFFPCEKNP